MNGLSTKDQYTLSSTASSSEIRQPCRRLRHEQDEGDCQQQADPKGDRAPEYLPTWIHLLDRYTEFKHEWEPQFLAATKDLVFRNSFKDIEYILQTCYDNDTRFESECYDIAHLYNLKHFFDRGVVKVPLFFNPFSVFWVASARILKTSCT